MSQAALEREMEEQSLIPLWKVYERVVTHEPSLDAPSHHWRWRDLERAVKLTTELVHGKDADPFFLEDLEAARALVDSTERAELFLYPGKEHLFADSSVSDYDPAAAALLTERALGFLETVRE